MRGSENKWSEMGEDVYYCESYLKGDIGDKLFIQTMILLCTQRLVNIEHLECLQSSTMS